ncbi:MAG: hypothetical protein IMZ52_10175 [Actinobacteria bacterium]|nr:hypothetical protein [Actinomycetota bacterium]MBE3122567.1 hypothetical protein [Thermoplasmata archaeon]
MGDNIRTSEQIHIAVGAFDKLFPLDAKTYRNEKWVSYDWLIEFLNHSVSLEVAIRDLKELNQKG